VSHLGILLRKSFKNNKDQLPYGRIFREEQFVSLRLNLQKELRAIKWKKDNTYSSPAPTNANLCLSPTPFSIATSISFSPSTILSPLHATQSSASSMINPFNYNKKYTLALHLSHGLDYYIYMPGHTITLVIWTLPP
jgi:hypothetical protein